VKPVAAPPPSATVTPIGSDRHWIARMPPGLFAIPFGLFGLAGAWRRLAAFDVTLAEDVAGGLLRLGTAVLLLLFVLQLMKEFHFRAQVNKDRVHPVHGAMLSLVALSVLMAVTLWLPAAAGARDWALCVTVAALAFQGYVVVCVMPRVATGEVAPDLVTPALYLPLVGGGLIGAMALQALGVNAAAVASFGIGVGAWLLLELRVMNRLFAGPLPPPLQPTLGVEIAPAPVALLSALALWPALPADAVVAGLGVACLPLAAVLARWRWWSSVPFAAGFWSFSFPIAAFAAVIVEATRRSGGHVAIAWAAVAAASLLIAFLLVRTVQLLVQRRLIPPG